MKKKKNKFNLCDWKCDNRNHKIKEYCQLSLWHAPLSVNFVPCGVYGNWVCKGHVFKCIHPTGNYFIFLVDQSGSMQNNSIKPTTDIGNKLPNKLGASIEVIINFCKKRYANNKKDIGALIGFNSKASLIFKNVSLDNIGEIKKSCLQYLIPQGKTYFIKAFKEASKILEKMNNNENDYINRRNYNPVIILLTDGLDNNPKITISFLENELMKNEKLRDNSCKIFCIYFGKNSNLSLDGKNILKQIAQIGQTDNYYNPNSLENLYETFDKISNAIQTN